MTPNSPRPYITAALAITGAAPVYDRQRENIVGAMVVRRIIDEGSAIVETICRNLIINAALFNRDRLITSCGVQETGDAFIQPEAETLLSVLSNNAAVSVADIGRGGSIAKLAPIRDFNGDPVGVLMVQRGVAAYLHTRNVAITTLLSIFLVGFLLALIIKTIVVRRIVVPVQRLKKGTKRIGQGEYGHRVDVTSGDEIGNNRQQLGLGVQPGYRVVGEGSLFENIYPKPGFTGGTPKRRPNSSSAWRPR